MSAVPAGISVATFAGARTGRRLGVLVPAALAVFLGLWLLSPAQASAAVESGALSQLPSPANCVGDTADGICGTEIGSGMEVAYQAVVSPDGANVYSIANSGALVEYSRNLATAH